MGFLSWNVGDISGEHFCKIVPPHPLKKLLDKAFSMLYGGCYADIGFLEGVRGNFFFMKRRFFTKKLFL